MRLSGLDLFFWIAGFFAHAALFAVLWARRRAVQFPFFTTLIGASAVETPVLYMVFRHGSGSAYFDTYWAFGFSKQILEVLVIYEIARKVFRPLGHWAPDVRRSAALLAGASVLVAAAVTWLAAPPTPHWQQTVVMKGTLFGAALMSELFVGMVVLSATVGLPWRTHVTRIAVALGLYSLAEILIYGAVNIWGLGSHAETYLVLSHLRIGLYLACLLYWVVALWQDAPRTQVLTPQHRERLTVLQAHVGSGLSSFRSSGRE